MASPTFHGLTMTPAGVLLAWSYPDGTVRVATLVYREGGRKGDVITPGRYEAVPHVVADPSALWPEATPTTDTCAHPAWVPTDDGFSVCPVCKLSTATFTRGD